MPKYGGRKKGTPNKVTAETRQLFVSLLEDISPQLQGWLTRVGETDPALALTLYLRLADFCIPVIPAIDRPQRQSVSSPRSEADNSPYMRVSTVRQLCNISRSTLFRLEKAGRFPARVRLGKRVTAWKRAEGERWIQERPKANDFQGV